MTVTAQEIGAYCPDNWAVHCRLGDHARCSMVCACPHHDEPRAFKWTDLPPEQRLRLIEGDA